MLRIALFDTPPLFFARDRTYTFRWGHEVEAGVLVFMSTLTQPYPCPPTPPPPAPSVCLGFIPARVPSTNSARYVRKIWWLLQKGGAWSFLLVIPLVAVVYVLCDTPQREEARAALREARKSERDEALRRKSQ